MNDIINLFVLDRDGTINYDPGWFGKDPGWKKDLRLLDGVVEGIKKLNILGKVVVVSNQFGVARGYFTEDTVLEINKEIASRFNNFDAKVDSWQFCPYVEYDWAKRQGLDLNSPWVKKEKLDLYKPNTGMIKRGAKELGLDLNFCRVYSIGNRLSDAETGVNAGGIGIIIKDEKYSEEFEKVRELSAKNKSFFAVNNFLEAVELIQKNLK